MSSLHNGTRTDIIIDSPHLHPPVTTIDATVSCPLLPTYLSAATTDAAAIFQRRDNEKLAKHLPGCIDLERAYLSIVFTTLGAIGPSTARDYLDSLFAPSYAEELIAGGTGATTARRRQLFFMRMHTLLTRTTAAMISSRANPPPPVNGRVAWLPGSQS